MMYQMLPTPNSCQSVAVRRIWVSPQLTTYVGEGFRMRLVDFGLFGQLARVCFFRGSQRVYLPLMCGVSLDCPWLALSFIPKALKRDQRGRIKAILLECHAMTEEVQFA